MKICERCGAEHDGLFGSGRFCSKSCANKRDHSKETKDKIRSSVIKNIEKSLGANYRTKRELRKLDRLNELNDFIETVNNSDNMSFINCPDIDFGTKYVVTKDGDVISTHTKRSMSRLHRGNDKYQRVVLVDVDGNEHMMLVHRLVAFTFIPNPDNLPIVNHKDENPENNCVDNLEWCTYQYNAMYNDAHIKRGKMLHEKYIKNKK